ncbi:hypothetical protein PQS34_15930 [Bacillus altitudinis]|uniref:hypothetical protein n=1 Tax=Bacillus altitudinis TaxID=293387 RepID=UPI001F4E6099|nr:hypothetical protein [Bacillus altitudinis]MDC7797573.1 hypothetical protein [Bacillus altitudinis]UNG01765.1 hypothetical protein MMZ59_03090 [Bacillus altitudinis]
MAFKTSVNIRFDVGKEEFVNRYIPTPSHTEVLKGILDGFIKESNRSHIIIGAYGTGKSLLATVVSSLVSKSTSKQGIDKIINKFSHFDDYIAEQISLVSKQDVKYLPVLLNGNEGRFRKAILSGITKALNLEGIDVILPGIGEKILASIQKWKHDFPETYKKFVDMLESEGREIDSWLNEIKNQNEDEIKYFSLLYPSLTSGAVFEMDYDESFMTQIEYIIELLNKQNLGVFIVHDEFGRFLQGLSISNINETMQDIQDLAELTDRSKLLQFVLITHRSLRQYFKGMNEEIAKEFQRIEKRFRQYNITSDQLTFLKIAEVILAENLVEKPEVLLSDYEVAIKNLKEYTLFPSLNPTERERIIAKSMYPLHPVSLFILPHLSSVFGQNERTLFTFLESEETGGLKNHISKSDSYYLPYQLFDYFFPNVDENDIDDELSKSLLLYRKAIARVPVKMKNKKIAFNLIKFLSIWDICSLQKEQKLSTEFLKFAMKVDSELEDIINNLTKQKVIRFNRLGEFWEIHTGSTVDIQEKILQKKKSISISKAEILKVLQKNLSKKYFFPERYNDEKDMTRFAKVELLLESDLDKFKSFNNRNNDLDLIIYYIIPESTVGAGIKEAVLNLDASEKVFFVIHPEPVTILQTELDESFILETLKSDKELLSEDKGIKEELLFLLKEANHVIGKFLSTLLNFDDRLIWINNKNINDFNNEVQLSEALSNICYNLYPETPNILSESFNRKNPPAPQIAGAKKLIDSIISSHDKDQFGIKGTGPEYAIYAAVFRRNSNFNYNINNLDYRNIEYRPYRLIRDQLLQLLTEQPKGSFKNIIDIFTGSPFGIRKPLIPVLFVALLRDRWNEFMLYRNEIFVPALNGDKLYEIMLEEGPENYQYVFEQIDEEYIQFFNMVENHFVEHIEERLQGQSNSRLIQICGTLLKWLRSLPRLTQLSQSVNEEFSSFREIIRKTEVNPQQSMKTLFVLFGNANFINLLRLKEYAEDYLLGVKVNLEQTVLSLCDFEDIAQLRNWARDQHEYLKKNNEFVRTINSLQNESDWVSVFFERFTGVMVEDWSDKTYEKCLKDLQYSYQEAVSFKDVKSTKEKESTSVDYITVKVGQKTKVISKVEFSPKTKSVYNSVNGILKSGGRNIPKNEMEYLIYLLMEQYVE